MCIWVAFQYAFFALPRWSNYETFNDVRISSSPKNFSTWHRLNQFYSSLSTNTSIFLRLNSSDLLLALETFNKEDIFIYSSFWSKTFLYPVTKHKKPKFMPTTFLFLFSLLLTCTNPRTLMDVKQWLKVLLLLRFFDPSEPYNHHTI